VSVYIFVGPTLRREEVTAACEAVCLPPVAQGDVYRIAQARPRAIGIIDGYFAGAPAVWHKEILWALAQGILVFGSASMGALRAAELHQFGMQGVGQIFEAFRDGVLEDDDEVAVIHGPAEIGYPAMSEPMVNIRATLARATRDGVLSAEANQRIETAAKSLFFPQRNWTDIVAAAAAQGVEPDALATLRDWLPGHRIDQKRADALAMLASMQRMLAQPNLSPPRFHFERTHLWERLTAAPREPADPGTPEMQAQHDVLEELRLQGPARYSEARMAAGLQHFAGLASQGHQLTASPEAKREELTRLREALGLATRAALEAWLLRNDLDGASLERLLEERVLTEAALGQAAGRLDDRLIDHLRLAGLYETLRERARQKEQVLARLPGGHVVPEPGPRTAELRAWYFEQRAGMPIPVDISAYIRALGFAELADFDGAVYREWLYLRSVSENFSV
jgi:hypothetical protein